MKPRQNYALAVVSIGVAPWLPVIIEWTIEWLYARPITIDSLVITLACYSVTVALATNDAFLCILFLILSGFDSAIYGALLADTTHDATRQAVLIAVISLLGLLTFLSVLRERYDRHVRRHEIFFEWLKPGERKS
ncbi:MAG: hypothetical protein ACRDNT_00040 [Streptosporangiaceae bacterium]